LQDGWHNTTNIRWVDVLTNNTGLNNTGTECKNTTIIHTCITISGVTNCTDNIVTECKNTTSPYTCNPDACNLTEKEQVQQEYRDYTCSGASCNYGITNTRWIDTGSIRSKPDIKGPTTYYPYTQIKCDLLNITATVKDLCSNVSEAEYFFNNCPSVSTRGAPLLALDGTFDEKIEDVYKNLVNVSTLNDGINRLYVRGKDDKGNWGQCTMKFFYVLRWMCIWKPCIPRNLTCGFCY
jgi:hypothetical protein